MSNPEERPEQVDCPAERAGAIGDVRTLTPREVPLGGIRAMPVRRTLPQRERSFIGAWCFLDHYGPDRVDETGGMVVAPHPHTGLQTVSWLFEGEIEHRDSAGNVAMVRPGELNLMTGGHGISHSEVSTPGTTVLHGAQLWVALPFADRDLAPGFAHYAPAGVSGEGWRARVFLGSVLGDASPVETSTPLLGAELVLSPGASLSVPVDPDFEHGVLVDLGGVSVQRHRGAGSDLVFVPAGAAALELVAGPDGCRLLLLGGPPFGESIVMWWNFVGRTHEEIVGFRDEWQAQITESGEITDGRFGVVPGQALPPIPAPPLPNARLRTRE